MARVIVDARDAALTALLDDATTVPPGRSDLSSALMAHLAHRRGPHAWTLGRFVASPVGARSLAGQLAAAWTAVGAATVEGQGEAPPPPIPLTAVLPRSGMTNLARALETELAALAALARDPGVALVAVQVTLAGQVPAEEIDVVMSVLSGAGLLDRRQVDCEVALAGRPAGEVVRRLEALAAARAVGADMVAKLRLSGTLPAATPSTTEVAGFLRTCAALDVPVRATAARQVRTPAGVSGEPAGAAAAARPGPRVRRGGVPDAHGLLNILGAAAVAHQGGSLADIRAVLAPSGDIGLDSGALTVGGDVVCESQLLDAAREHLLHGIGCADLDGVLDQLAATGALASSERTS